MALQCHLIQKDMIDTVKIYIPCVHLDEVEIEKQDMVLHAHTLDGQKIKELKFDISQIDFFTTIKRTERVKLPSSDTNINVLYHFDEKFLEIELSLPKLMYYTNAVMLYDFKKALGFLKQILEKQFQKEFVAIDWWCVKRVDVCHNWLFDSREDVNVYLNLFGMLIDNAYMRSNKIEKYKNGSWATQSSYVRRKMYHKGDEFEVNDLGKLKKLVDRKKITEEQLQKIHNLASRELRFEVELKEGLFDKLDETTLSKFWKEFSAQYELEGNVAFRDYQKKSKDGYKIDQEIKTVKDFEHNLSITDSAEDLEQAVKNLLMCEPLLENQGNGDFVKRLDYYKNIILREKKNEFYFETNEITGELLLKKKLHLSKQKSNDIPSLWDVFVFLKQQNKLDLFPLPYEVGLWYNRFDNWTTKVMVKDLDEKTLKTILMEEFDQILTQTSFGYSSELDILNKLKKTYKDPTKVRDLFGFWSLCKVYNKKQMYKPLEVGGLGYKYNTYSDNKNALQKAGISISEFSAQELALAYNMCEDSMREYLVNSFGQKEEDVAKMTGEEVKGAFIRNAHCAALDESMPLFQDLQKIKVFNFELFARNTVNLSDRDLFGFIPQRHLEDF